MLKLVVKRVLTFSAVMVFVFALFMLDTDSPSLISEAQACDPQAYDVCEFNCFYACWSNLIGECLPWQCDCGSYCRSYCQAVTGC
jgi:hypothetical protein